MVENIQRALASLNKKKDESEKGFSLIELIVVVAILGILVAIAIPVYNGLQDKADTNALKTVAANGATQLAALIAEDPTHTPVVGDISNLAKDGISFTLTGETLGTICVTALKTGVTSQTSGPGCA